jgi:hypothetical protein
MTPDFLGEENDRYYEVTSEPMSVAFGLSQKSTTSTFSTMQAQLSSGKRICELFFASSELVLA